jgi:hypothetical protein
MFSGIAKIQSRTDLYSRISLLIPDVGLSLGDAHKAFLDKLDDARVNRVIEEGSSETITQIIRRFSSIEGNCYDSNLKGLGRVSPHSFPRLGGVLNPEVERGTGNSEMIVAAVERTVHAGYLTAAALVAGEDRKVRVTDVHQLWDRWLPLAYSISDRMADVVFNTCAIDDFWMACLDKFTFPKALKKLKSGRPSEIGASIGGLATTGLGLFLAERPPE